MTVNYVNQSERYEKMTSILIVEDDTNINNLLVEAFCISVKIMKKTVDT